MAQSLIEIYVEMHNVTKTKSESVEKHDGFLPPGELSFKVGMELMYLTGDLHSALFRG